MKQKLSANNIMIIRIPIPILFIPIINYYGKLTCIQEVKPYNVFLSLL